MTTILTSIQNPKIQRVRRLRAQKKARDEEGKFMIEGVRLVEEALRQNALLETIFYAEPAPARVRTLLDDARAVGIETIETAPTLIDAISDTRNAQPLIAIAQKRDLPIPNEPTFILILDEIHDPGNLGTILRTAAAAGVDCVLLSPGCADPSAPKVVRSAMGAHFSIPIYELNWDEIRTFFSSRPEIVICAAAVEDSENFWLSDYTKTTALILGSEAQGIGPDAAALARRRILIPMTGRIESMNAAIAAAILMYEVRRQRSL